MLERQVASALRPLRQRRTLSCLAARSFSSSQSRCFSALITETENDNLNKILRNIQDKIILPSYLPERKRKLIFEPKKRAFLKQNPIDIELEGYEHRFTFIDRFTDLPDAKKALWSALAAMKTPEDWANLGTLLQGYRQANIKLKPHHWAKIARMAIDSGNIYTVIECAKQADRTGFATSQPEVVLRVLSALADGAANSSGDVQAAKQALRATELMQDLTTRWDQESKVKRLGLSNLLLVRGLALLSRAAYVEAKQTETGEQDEQDLQRLGWEADCLQQGWREVREKADIKSALDLPEVSTPDLAVSKDPSAAVRSRGNQSPIGLSLLVRVVAQNIKAVSKLDAVQGLAKLEDASVIEQELEKYLAEAVRARDGDKAYLGREYEQVLGRAPSWA